MRKSARTQERLWAVGEKLFMEKGLAAVTMQDIAAMMEMRHASLYYYIPQGKEQLYVQVIERTMHKHYVGLTDAIASAGDNFRAQMHAVAIWFASHPPLDLGRIVRSDLPILNDADAEHIINMSLQSLRLPIANALRTVVANGQLSLTDVDFAAMGLIALVQSVHNIPERFIESPETLKQLAIRAADNLLDGWYKR